MRRLTINGKEYTFVFSIEASLYNECTEAMMNMFLSFGEAQGEAEGAASIVKDNVEGARSMLMSSMRKTFTSMSNIPQTALTLFYAGLLEEHGDSIRSKNDAKALMKDYIKENNYNFYDVVNEMMAIMCEDHFFDLTGLSKLLTEAKTEETEEPKKGRKKKDGEN